MSTEEDEQATSYKAQVDYYTSYIKSRADWQFVKVYTDEGITGTSIRKRDGFKSREAFIRELNALLENEIQNTKEIISSEIFDTSPS